MCNIIVQYKSEHLLQETVYLPR